MPKDKIYDLIIVGAGPAGLSAAINAESERVNTLVLDAADQLGGQAGTSSLIENYPGFPQGVSGKTLASLMIDQALKFETEFLGPWRAAGIEGVDGGLLVRDDTEAVLGRAVLICSGVDYRRLIVPNIAAYLGRGVSYGSPNLSRQFSGKKLYVVGGANSAGQAAKHLSSFTDCEVNLIVRGNSIDEKMSAYLVDRIMTTPNIKVHTNTTVTGVDGDGMLKEISLKSGELEKNFPADEIFILIGAAPRTGWLPGIIERDNLGFIRAGVDLGEVAQHTFIDSYHRVPLPHETCMAGLFVAGDVRCGTTKRVASAVGDGANSIPDIHRYLARLKESN